jgi:hypothetical protein
VRVKRAAAIGFVLGILLPLLAELSNNLALEEWVSPGLYVAIWLPVDDLSFASAFAVMLAANAVVFAVLAVAGLLLTRRFLARSRPG